jgi:hypothetical protein
MGIGLTAEAKPGLSVELGGTTYPDTQGEVVVAAVAGAPKTTNPGKPGFDNHILARTITVATLVPPTTL